MYIAAITVFSFLDKLLTFFKSIPFIVKQSLEQFGGWATENLFWWKVLVIIAIFAITLAITAFSTVAERKMAAFFQDRLGPNRAGPYGIFQVLADAVKLFFKEDFIPAKANKWLFILGPCLSMFTALMSSAVIPFGQSFSIGGKELFVQAIDVNIGILYIFGIVSLGVYGIMIGGWASNNKFSLLGAVRAASQNISYELALGMSMIAVLMLTGSLSIRDIVNAQHGGAWNIFIQPLGFVIFMTCALAECNRTPFDLPECETELVGGHHTEYSSMKMGFYLFSEFANMFISAAVITCLYFGGYNYPGMDVVLAKLQAMLGQATGQNIATALGILVMLIKSLFGVFFFMWIRWTLPRFRHDQLMNLGWKGLIPASILNIVVTGFGILSNHNWASWIAVAIIIVVGILQAQTSAKKRLAV
jgi:NADH-quinone oxidoreductase subunit H